MNKVFRLASLLLLSAFLGCGSETTTVVEPTSDDQVKMMEAMVNGELAASEEEVKK